MTEEAPKSADTQTENPEITQKVEEVIQQVRPYLQADGGDIELVGVNAKSGIVTVRLQGACSGCPSAQMTLKMGVERHLKEKVPEVTEVVAV
jgi:Fe-S cluster biogenesis protein NfuA